MSTDPLESQTASRGRPGPHPWNPPEELDPVRVVASTKYFEDLEVREGARIILCWSKPTWAKLRSKPDEHDLLARFVRQCVPEHATVPLYLSGDSHHFAHYRSRHEDVHWVTAGGGGAFLHPTHHLDHHVELPDESGTMTHLDLADDDPWPSKRTSRWLLVRLAAFPRYNPSFLLFTAALHLLLAWAIQFGLRGDDESFAGSLKGLRIGEVFWGGFVRNPVSLLLGLFVIVGFYGFAKPPRKGKNGYRLYGALHGVFHVALALFLIRYLSQWLDTLGDSALFSVAFLVGVGLAGGLLSGVLVGVYLLVTNLVCHMHDNEAFSALHHDGFKHFLRIRIDSSGLNLYLIGLEKVGKRWDKSRSAAEHRPPCDDAEKVVARCIRTIRIGTPDQGQPAVHVSGGMDSEGSAENIVAGAYDVRRLRRDMGNGGFHTSDEDERFDVEAHPGSSDFDVGPSIDDDEDDEDDVDRPSGEVGRGRRTPSGACDGSRDLDEPAAGRSLRRPDDDRLQVQRRRRGKGDHPVPNEPCSTAVDDLEEQLKKDEAEIDRVQGWMDGSVTCGARAAGV